MSRKSHPTSAITLTDARLTFGARKLWDKLQLSIGRGEFIAVLGPNGSGKTSLVQVLLGLQALDAGTVNIGGAAATRGNKTIGYIPQQKSFDSDLPIRGRDLVRLGLDGHQFGLRYADHTRRINEVLEQVGATAFADKPLGVLSGGEQQRLRVAQALVGNPDILLCDEPLLSLDIASQRVITSLINDYRTRTNATVVFITHEINPVLPWVDRILYLANGQWLIDTPNNVLNSKTLSKLYGTAVDVIKVHGHIHVIADENAVTETGEHHHTEGAH